MGYVGEGQKGNLPDELYVNSQFHCFLKRISQALNSKVPLKDHSDFTTIPKATKRNRIENRQTIGTEEKMNRFSSRKLCPS